MDDDQIDDEKEERERELRRRVAERLQQENVKVMAQVTNAAIVRIGNRLAQEGAKANLVEIASLLTMASLALVKTAQVHMLAFGPRPPRKISTKPRTGQDRVTFTVTHRAKRHEEIAMGDAGTNSGSERWLPEWAKPPADFVPPAPEPPPAPADETRSVPVEEILDQQQFENRPKIIEEEHPLDPIEAAILDLVGDDD